jgi:hypothetical protein
MYSRRGTWNRPSSLPDLEVAAEAQAADRMLKWLQDPYGFDAYLPGLGLTPDGVSIEMGWAGLRRTVGVASAQ